MGLVFLIQTLILNSILHCMQRNSNCSGLRAQFIRASIWGDPRSLCLCLVWCRGDLKPAAHCGARVQSRHYCALYEWQLKRQQPVVPVATTEAYQPFCFGHSTWYCPVPKTNAPILSPRRRYKRYILSSCMFLHATCLRFKLVHVVENVQQRPPGVTLFRLVADLVSRSLSLPDSDLASRIDCSCFGPRMLTLNFAHWILQLNLAYWIWGRWKYLSWNEYIEFRIGI